MKLMRTGWWLAIPLATACGGGEPPSAGATPTVAQERAAAPQRSSTPAPVAGSVLGAEIRTQDADDLRYYVLRALTDRYAEEKGIAVTQAEVDAYVRHVRAAMKDDPNLRGAGEESAEDRAAHRQIAEAFIRQWKINKALYEQYGGRAIFQQGGPEPLDAYRTFLEEAHARGDFKITSAPLESKFWRYYRDDSLHSFYPPGSPEAKRAFAAPPWGS